MHKAIGLPVLKMSGGLKSAKHFELVPTKYITKQNGTCTLPKEVSNVDFEDDAATYAQQRN